MSAHSTKAFQLFRSGYNCAQSVVGAFADRLPVTYEVAMKLASPFGGGIGRLRETCGAASGMLLVIGLTEGYFETEDINEKAALYQTVQSLMKEFQNRLGSYCCRELLGGNISYSPIPTPRTEEFYRTRPCEKIIMAAAELLDDYFSEKPESMCASDSTKK